MRRNEHQPSSIKPAGLSPATAKTAIASRDRSSAAFNAPNAHHSDVAFLRNDVVCVGSPHPIILRLSGLCLFYFHICRFGEYYLLISH